MIKKYDSTTNRNISVANYYKLSYFIKGNWSTDFYRQYFSSKWVKIRSTDF
jgi:hypothetical protein